MERSTALRTQRPAEEATFQLLLHRLRARLDRELAAFLARKREPAARRFPPRPR